MEITAGVDEVGRGPLAGPVIAAAVILDPENTIAGLTDSKKLSKKKRKYLSDSIIDSAIAVGIGRAEPAEIDEINILQATLKAMLRAIEALSHQPTLILVDGNHVPDCNLNLRAVVKGDLLIPEISAASIMAKVTRDSVMIEMDNQYPGYGFANHMGYPTREHLHALYKLGPCPIHRRSFRPVNDVDILNV